MARRPKLTAAVALAKSEQAADSGAPAPQPQQAPNRRPNPFAARENALADVAQGRVRDVRLRLVDPATCRMWSKHNRLYELLTPENCDDLISSIRAQGRQEVPALVRRVPDDPDGYAFEVISGARRHFAVTHLREVEHRKEISFLVEVRELEDEEAFRLSDLENRSRQDISDYERGLEYASAIGLYYEGNLTRMADRMEVSKSLLSSYLSVARLPMEIVSAYGDPRGIAVRHGQQLNPLLNGPTRDALLGRAVLIAETQASLRANGAPGLPGAEVFKLLKGQEAAKPRPEPEFFGEAGGKPVLTARRKGRRLALDVDMNADEEAVIAAVRDAFRAAGQGRSTR